MVTTIKTIEEFSKEWYIAEGRHGLSVHIYDDIINYAKDNKWFRTVKEQIQEAESKGINILYYCQSGYDGKRLYFVLKDSDEYNLITYKDNILKLLDCIHHNIEPSLNREPDITHQCIIYDGINSCCSYFG